MKKAEMQVIIRKKRRIAPFYVAGHKLHETARYGSGE